MREGRNEIDTQNFLLGQLFALMGNKSYLEGILAGDLSIFTPAPHAHPKPHPYSDVICSHKAAPESL